MKLRISKIKDQSGFTLTELLAVIVIVAILIAASVPAFLSMGGSSHIAPAATQLSATLRQARQYAIANNQQVSVVFPHAASYASNATTSDLLYSDFNSKKRMLRGYAAYTPRDGYVTDWKFLPDGVIFNCETNTGTNVLYFDKTSEIDIVYPEEGTSPMLDMQRVTFRPDGSTHFGTIAYKIYLAPGFTNADEDPSHNAMSYTLTGPSTIYLEIAPLTGMVKVIGN